MFEGYPFVIALYKLTYSHLQKTQAMIKSVSNLFKLKRDSLRSESGEQPDHQTLDSLQADEDVISALISDFLHYKTVKEERPENLRMKNNILLILLCLSAYFIYHLFSDFKDTIVLAFLSGLAFQQSRDRFVDFWQITKSENITQSPLLSEEKAERHEPEKKSKLKKKQKKQKKTDPTDSEEQNAIIFEHKKKKQEQKQLQAKILKILKIGGLITFFFILPWIRFNIGNDVNIQQRLEWSQFLRSFQKTKNLTMIVTQIFIILYILYLIIGPIIYPFLVVTTMTHFRKKILSIIYAIFLILTVVILAVLIPITLTRQIIQTGDTIVNYTESILDCQIINQQNSSQAMCSDKFSLNSSKIQAIVSSIKPENEENLTFCINYIKSVERDYIGMLFEHSEAEICQAYSVVTKLSPYLFFSASDLMTTSKQVFVTVFGGVFSLLYNISNAFFSLTTFIAIFLITVEFFNHNQNQIFAVFDKQKQSFIAQTAKLIQGTIIITMSHFFISIFFLELFHISDFNLLLSIGLSSIAFVPIVRPIYFVVIGTAIKFYFQRTFSSIIFCANYWYISSKIYDNQYKKMGNPQIITNLSVLFGIYQFGVSGIIYGPLLIIAFQYVLREIFPKEKKSLMESTTSEILAH